MHLARNVVTAVAIAAVVSGCSWLNFRSGGNQRDPLLMSHLTHGKTDPMFAGSETALTFDDQSPIQAASVSRKYPKSQSLTPTQENTPGDFRWLKGRLERRGGPRPGWYLRYSDVAGNDPHGGAIRLQEDPRLGLLREGDHVYVEGEIIDSGLSQASYKLSSIRILAP